MLMNMIGCLWKGHPSLAMSCRNQDFDLDKQLSALTLEKTKVLKLTNVKNERKTSEIINLFPKIKDDLLVKWLDDSSVLVTFSTEETGFLDFLF